MFFGRSLFIWFIKGFVFAWDEGKFEVVESAFHIEPKSCWEWTVGERDVVVERVVEIVAAREYGLPFIH